MRRRWPTSSTRSSPPPAVVQDDLLRLLFTCCHPSLELDTRVALALRTLCGLSTAEVARVMLVGESAMSKRLTRAKQKIGVARIPFRVPGHDELPERVAGVAAVIHLVYTAGHAGSGSDAGAGRPVRGGDPARPPARRAPPRPGRWARASSPCCCSPTPGVRPGSTGTESSCRSPTRTAPGGTGPWWRKASACSIGRWWPPTASPTRTSSRRPSRPATTGHRASRPRTGRRSPGSTASSPPSTPTRWSTSTRRSRSRTPTAPVPVSRRWTAWTRRLAAMRGCAARGDLLEQAGRYDEAQDAFCAAATAAPSGPEQRHLARRAAAAGTSRP